MSSAHIQALLAAAALVSAAHGQIPPTDHPAPPDAPAVAEPVAPAQPSEHLKSRREQLRERLAQPQLPGVKVSLDIEYARPVGTDGKPGKPLKLDLFAPEVAPAAPLPLVIWIHGGGWEMGSKDRCPGARFVTRGDAKNGGGFVVASISYRLTDVACWPAQIHDCKAAVRFLRAHAAEYHIDPSRIGVWGASAGGHLSALLGVSAGVQELEGEEGNAGCSSAVQAVADWFGPTDFSDLPDALGERGMVAKLLCGPIRDHRDNARSASPVTYITPDDAPFLIMQGGKDTLVPKAQSEKLAERLRSVGVPDELKILDNAGHGIGFGAKDIETVAEFFEKTLKAGTPAKPTAAKQ